jgi:hypothetical protein
MGPPLRTLALVERPDPTERWWDEPEREYAMAETSDRRCVARLTVPRQLRGPELELHLVHLLISASSGLVSSTWSRCKGG